MSRVVGHDAGIEAVVGKSLRQRRGGRQKVAFGLSLVVYIVYKHFVGRKSHDYAATGNDIVSQQSSERFHRPAKMGIYRV